MSNEIAILAVLWVGLTLYALLGGADFGGGVLTALASGPSKEKQREMIAATIAPVWEANHVWLIFVITGLFAAFPPAFEALAVALYVPFSIALLGIVLRGSAFAFRAHSEPESGWRWTWTSVFSVASIITPFVLGAAAGAIANGDIHIDGPHITADALRVWLQPLPLLTGFLGLTICAWLAATYLTVEARAQGARDLEDTFRRRALIIGVAAGALALAGVLIISSDAPHLWHGMRHRGLPFVLLSVAGGLTCLAGLQRRRYLIARAGAILAVGAVLAGWGASQWPYLVVPDLTVRDAAALEPALRAILVGLIAGGVLLLPSLLVLFRVFKSAKALREPVEEPSEDLA
ncbi:MAG: cytochrome d ubiquinol oxidase subunit II [Actinomycetota bacterium]